MKIDSPNISADVATKTKKPQSAQITSNILKSIPGGKILSLIHMHGKGHRLKVTWILQLKWLFKMNGILRCSDCEMDCLESNFQKTRNMRDFIQSMQIM